MSQTITDEFILNDAHFSKLSHIELKYETITEFITNYIQHHPNKTTLLGNLSNLYVLVASENSHCILRDGENKWDNFLDPDQLKYLKQNGQYILGLILLGKKLKTGFRIIDFIDTRLRGYNLANYMMLKYNKSNDMMLIPGEIIETSVEFWKRYLCVNCKEDIYEWIDDIDYKYLQWNISID